MKKFTAFVLMLAMVMSTTACAPLFGEEKEPESLEKLDESVSTVGKATATPAKNRLYTKYFSIEIPEGMLDECFVTYDSMSVEFTHAASHKAQGYLGGTLFSIKAISVGELSDVPGFEPIMGITTPEGEKYNLCLCFPTGVEFPMEYMEAYKKNNALSDQIVKSIVCAEGCVKGEFDYSGDAMGVE